MTANNTLCLGIAKEGLRKARILLEDAGRVGGNNVDGLIVLRKRLEASFDQYLINRTSELRKEFDSVVQEIERRYSR